MKPFGEVIQSSLSSINVQSWQWNTMPRFGSLLVTQQGDIKIYAIVAHLQTGSNDPGRMPYAYQKTEEELQRDQPQIFALLQTMTTGIILGYERHGQMLYQLPPVIANIHAFVSEADDTDVLRFISKTQYLHLLQNQSLTQRISSDELILAFIAELLERNLLSTRYLHDIVHTIAAINRSDYRSLKLLLKRVQSLITDHKLSSNELRAYNVAPQAASFTLQETP